MMDRRRTNQQLNYSMTCGLTQLYAVTSIVPHIASRGKLSNKGRKYIIHLLNKIYSSFSSRE